MSIIKKLPRPLIIAHRGASAHAPENTMSAFNLAIEQNAEAIELDVKLTADEYPVALHDQTVDRTTDASGDVSSLFLSTVRELDAGTHFSRNYSYERIPTLEEVFDTIGHKTILNVELTNYATPRDMLPDIVAEMVIQHGLEDRVLFSSFLHMNLRRVKEILPQVPVAILSMKGFAGVAARRFMGRRVSPEFIHPHYKDLNTRLVEREKAHNRRIHVWTVNPRPLLQQMFSLGVDGVITDDPIKAREVLEDLRDLPFTG